MAADGDEGGQRARALALLEATHQFPCHYAVTVIAFNREPVTVAIRAACAPMQPVEDSVPQGSSAVASTGKDVGAYETRASREGKYLSHRFEVPVAQAAEVLELYARLRSVDGVVTIL